MFDSDLEKTIITAIFALWVGNVVYLNACLKDVHRKLDLSTELTRRCFDGLRDYLYSIDEQFDDERQAGEAFDNDESMFAGMDEMQLLRQKKSAGKRTLTTSFDDPIG